MFFLFMKKHNNMKVFFQLKTVFIPHKMQVLNIAEEC